jgi:mannose-6-phosphate isomerase-like protein (cupin superfamily)
VTDTALSDSYRPTVVERARGAIPARDAVTKLWGDDESGFATDLIYLSDEKIQQIIFELDPTARFTHSRRHRTIFGAHQVYRVLTGTLVLANPATGDLQPVKAGEYVYLPPRMWHHGFNQSIERLRVLEYFAPPPATGSSQPFARSQPYLEEARYAREEWLGRWPEALPEARRANAIKVVRESDLLWLAEGHTNPLIVTVAFSVPELTVCAAKLLPGKHSDLLVRREEQAGFVTDGTLGLLLEPPGERRSYYQMAAGDGFLVPAETPYRFLNGGENMTCFTFGVAGCSPARAAPSEPGDVQP